MFAVTDLSAAVTRLADAQARIADPALEGGTVFTEIFPTSAGTEAELSDARFREGASRGALDGRIVSIKALVDVAGYTTRAGTKVLRGQPPAIADAPLLARLRAAGSVIVGRTVMTEFAFSAVGLNPHDGTAGNPFDRSLIAGGSSTGAAVSVAADMAEIAIGSDTGGSIRIPAALCGITGFKPTSGQVPTEGVFPLSPTLDVIGPLARNVRDCADTFAILTGAAPRPLPRLAASDVRITRLSGRLVDDSEPAVASAIDAAYARITVRGITVADGDIEAELDLMAQLDGIGFFPAVELAATLKSLGFSSLDGIDPRTAARITAGEGVLAVDYLTMQARRRSIIAQMDARLGSGEILAMPTVPITAVPIASVEDPAEFHRVNGLLLRNTRVGNLFDLPSISLPVPTTGAPVGLMLMAGRGQDERLLAVASVIEAALAAD
jgi:aspartyl-tRNA(Asn)/glutamyl-tRNA(Gln) amidotransferase subunit A